MRIISFFLQIIFSKMGIVIIGILLSIVASLSSIALLAVSSWFLASAYVIASTSFNFFYPSSSVRGLAISRTFFRYIQRLVTHNATLAIMTKLQLRMFSSLLPINNKDRKVIDNVDILNKTIVDVGNINNFYLQLVVPIIANFIVFVVITIILSFIDPFLGLTTGIVMLIVLLLLPFIFYPLGKKSSQKIVELSNLSRNKLIKYLQFQMENLFFLQTEKKNEEILSINEEFITAQNEQNKLLSLANIIIQLIVGVLIIFALYTSSHLDILNSPIDELKTTSVLFVFVILGCIELLLPLANMFLQMGQIYASMKRIYPLLNTTHSKEASDNVINTYYHKEDLENWSNLYPEQLEQDIIDRIKFIDIEVKNFSLDYDSQPVFTNYNFSFQNNENFFIIGESGCGKTSLVKAILGLENDYIGSIIINSYDTNKELVLSLDAKSGQQRQFITNMSQRVYIFNESVRDNLLISNSDIKDEDMLKILADLNLSHILDIDGLDTILGMGGRYLSGGEIRRIGIARLLLSNSKAAIIDEPLESLDDESADKFFNKILEQYADKLLIVVTHKTNLTTSSQDNVINL